MARNVVGVHCTAAIGIDADRFIAPARFEQRRRSAKANDGRAFCDTRFRHILESGPRVCAVILQQWNHLCSLNKSCNVGGC